MHETTHEAVAKLLHQSRQRYTRGRRRLVDALAHAQRPMTVADLGQVGEVQSVSSLYRNLAILESCGAVQRIASVRSAVRYELAEGLTGHHHHLSCVVCGRLDDLVLPAELEAAFAQAAEQARRQADFDVDTHRFELVGTCVDCALPTG